MCGLWCRKTFVKPIICHFGSKENFLQRPQLSGHHFQHVVICQQHQNSISVFEEWFSVNYKETNLITPDANIPVCNRFIPLDSDLIRRQSSAPDPWRSGRAWCLDKKVTVCKPQSTARHTWEEKGERRKFKGNFLKRRKKGRELCKENFP